MKRKRQIVAGLIISFLVVLGLMIGPMDIFCHGFYNETVDFGVLGEVQQYTELSEKPFRQTFSPAKKHFKGFEIFVDNVEPENSGKLFLTIFDESENLIDQAEVDVNDLQSKQGFQVFFSKELKVGQRYILQISAENCFQAPYLLIADSDYLTEENIEGNLLIRYAYAESTYSFSEKVLIIWILICIGVLILGKILVSDKEYWKKIVKIVGGTSLVIILTWTYMFNTFDREDSLYDTYSESLVIGTIQAKHLQIEPLYNIGHYIDAGANYNQHLKTYFDNPDTLYRTDEEFEKGYSKSEPVIAVSNNNYTQLVGVVGNSIRFFCDKSYQIIDVTEDSYYRYLRLDTTDTLNWQRCGSIADADFLDQQGTVYPKGIFSRYSSQYGLQSKVFTSLSQIMRYEGVIEKLYLFMSILLAVVFVLISYLIGKKYDKLLAGCFYITFWLSPWIGNFARNLYWVEVTWFIPMLVGLYCSIKINNQRSRRFCYVAALVSIMMKCLCGYEYITSIMLGLIMFLLVDAVVAAINKDKKQAVLIIKTIIIIGVMALLGFLSAMMIHAFSVGDGDLMIGLQQVKSEAMYRTTGGKIGNYGTELRESFNASIWSVLCKYTHFSTEIIAGIPGNLFPLMSFATIAILVWKYMKREMVWRDAVLYCMSLLVPVSWFVLAKGHSYIHVQMNYVLWYFGYVQVCLYVIVKHLLHLKSKREN